MSSYSHRGYEHRTGGYGRRRRKSSGFRKKNPGKTVAKVTAATAAAAAVIVLVYLFADNISPFVNSFRKEEAVQTVDTPETAQIKNTDDEAVQTLAKGSFDEVDSDVFISNGSGFLKFKGIDTTAKNYAAVLNSISSSVSDSVNVYAAVIPTNTEIGLEGVLQGSNPQKMNLEVINSSLSDRVRYIDVYSVLSAHKNEYVYFRTDPCITSLGGYYTYREIAETAGFDNKNIYSLDTLSEKSGVIPRFEGEYLARTSDAKKQPHGNQELFNNADTIEYYKLPVHYNCYSIDPVTGGRVETDLFSETDIPADDPLSVFPAKDTKLLYIENIQNSSTKKLLIIKDHVAEPVIGYLVPQYTQVHIADASLYSGDLLSYINENEITDVLFINGIDDANNSLYCQRLRDLFDNSISDQRIQK